MVSDYGGQDHDKAGEIATQLLKRVKDRVKPGVKLIDIAAWVEEETTAMGGQPAFPCSVAVNDYAAHYAPLFGDESVIPANSMVKVDLGVHINGYICDCATTLNFNDKLAYLERASTDALKAAVDSIRAGATISEIGRNVHESIRKYNANPIFNLSGHTMSPYTVHAGLSILNHDNPSTAMLEEGMVVALEPFTTNGKGYVSDHGNPGIYAISEVRNVRNPVGRKILTRMFGERKTLPFAERWLHSIEGSRLALSSAIRELVSAGILDSYPPLRENSGGMVSQHECTVLVEKNGCHFIGGYEV